VRLHPRPALTGLLSRTILLLRTKHTKHTKHTKLSRPPPGKLLAPGSCQEGRSGSCQGSVSDQSCDIFPRGGEVRNILLVLWVEIPHTQTPALLQSHGPFPHRCATVRRIVPSPMTAIPHIGVHPHPMLFLCIRVSCDISFLESNEDRRSPTVYQTNILVTKPGFVYSLRDSSAGYSRGKQETSLLRFATLREFFPIVFLFGHLV